MIINIVQTKPGTELEQELNILTRDTHSPSGRLLREVLDIHCSNSAGYGTVYKVSSGHSGPDLAIEGYRELQNRCPSLLLALFETASMNSPHLEVHVQRTCMAELLNMTSEQAVSMLPKLIAWLSK